MSFRLVFLTAITFGSQIAFATRANVCHPSEVLASTGCTCYCEEIQKLSERSIKRRCCSTERPVSVCWCPEGTAYLGNACVPFVECPDWRYKPLVKRNPSSVAPPKSKITRISIGDPNRLSKSTPTSINTRTDTAARSRLVGLGKGFPSRQSKPPPEKKKFNLTTSLHQRRPGRAGPHETRGSTKLTRPNRRSNIKEKSRTVTSSFRRPHDSSNSRGTSPRSHSSDRKKISPSSQPAPVKGPNAEYEYITDNLGRLIPIRKKTVPNNLVLPKRPISRTRPRTAGNVAGSRIHGSTGRIDTTDNRSKTNNRNTGSARGSNNNRNTSKNMQNGSNRNDKSKSDGKSVRHNPWASRNHKVGSVTQPPFRGTNSRSGRTGASGSSARKVHAVSAINRGRNQPTTVAPTEFSTRYNPWAQKHHEKGSGAASDLKSNIPNSKPPASIRGKSSITSVIFSGKSDNHNSQIASKDFDILERKPDTIRPGTAPRTSVRSRGKKRDLSVKSNKSPDSLTRVHRVSKQDGLSIFPRHKLPRRYTPPNKQSSIRHQGTGTSAHKTTNKRQLPLSNFQLRSTNDATGIQKNYRKDYQSVTKLTSKNGNSETASDVFKKFAGSWKRDLSQAGRRRAKPGKKSGYKASKPKRRRNITRRYRRPPVTRSFSTIPDFLDKKQFYKLLKRNLKRTE